MKWGSQVYTTFSRKFHENFNKTLGKIIRRFLKKF